VVDDLENAALSVRQAAFQGVLRALNAAFKACATMLSPNDHTLRDLALLGHPYSKTTAIDYLFNSRRWKINRGKTYGPQQLHDPDELVHYQSGKYRDALRKITPVGQFGWIIEGRIEIDSSMEELDQWIQDGTVKMRGRPWMKWIVEHYGEEFMAIIEASIGSTLGRIAIGAEVSASHTDSGVIVTDADFVSSGGSMSPGVPIH
jgi:hypothetical protein